MNFFFVIKIFIGIAISAVSSYLYFRIGWKSLFFFIPAFISLIFGLFQINFIQPIVFAPIICGITFGYIVKNVKSFQIYIIVTSLVLVLIYSVHHYYSIFLNGFDYSKFLLDGLGKYNLTEVQKEYLNNNKEFIISITKFMMPFALFVKSLILSFVFYIFNKSFFEGIVLKKTATYKRVEFFRLNDYVIFLIIGSIAFIILGNEINNDNLLFCSLNILFMLLMFYFIQALGIIRFLLIKKNLPVAILPLLFILIIAFQANSLAFVVILFSAFGALDLWADFRKINKPDDKMKVS